jgi:hypothetical protein
MRNPPNYTEEAKKYLKEDLMPLQLEILKIFTTKEELCNSDAVCACLCVAGTILSKSNQNLIPPELLLEAAIKIKCTVLRNKVRESN